MTSISNNSNSTAIRTFQDLRAYLSTPFRASFQVGEHPSLPITLYAVSWKRKEPHIATHGKHFGSIEHLFYHYNKYNAGSALDKAMYVENGVYTPRVLEHLIFQEGPYSTLSVAKTLELSPDEWADIPALVSIDSVLATGGVGTLAASSGVATAPASQNTITYTSEESASRTPVVQSPPLRNKSKIAELHRRCDAIQHEIEERRRLYAEAHAEVHASLNLMEASIRGIEASSNILESMSAVLLQQSNRNIRTPCVNP